MSEQVTADAAVAALGRLVGTWKVTGGAEGSVTYRWMDGKYFMIQDVALEQYGQQIKGMEVIGRERPYGAEKPSDDIKSRFYANSGDTLDYVYEMEADVLTIWAGERGSPAYFRGQIEENGNILSGAWTFPGGGGYESTMTRLDGSDAR